MHARFHKQVILFSAAVLVPSLLLAALGIRLLLQEGELRAARLEQDKRLAARALSLELTEGLESRPSEAVVAELMWRRGEILLPWEIDRERSATEISAASEEYRGALSRGEAAEFAGADCEAATQEYAEALVLAESPAPKALARLNLVRCLISDGQAEEAARHVRELLRLSPTVTDEYGVPFALFAIAQALRIPGALAVDAPTMAEDLVAGDPWLAPATLRTIASFGQPPQAEPADAAAHRPSPADAPDFLEPRGASSIDVLLARSLRLESLRDEFGGLFATAGLTGMEAGDPQTWLAARGEPLWLVGVKPEQERSAVNVVRAAPLLAATTVAAQGLELTTARSETGAVPLGPRFPGILVRFRQPFDVELAATSRLQRLLYGGVLFVTVSFTAFGAWFLVRDLRREATLIEMRSRFVASVSHELKTPLTAVRMFAETLQRDRLPADKRARYVETILAESERLSRLLDNVLDFSKIERGEKRYRLEPVGLQEPLRRAMSALGPQLERQGCRLESSIDENVPAVVADPDAIEQAVVNLLSNAVKYSNGEARIDLALHRHGEEAVISVRDRGIGIDEEDRARIFNEFFRAGAVDRSQVPGTGLGLTIVAHIAEAHGARIDVDSEPGEGSTFSLRIPIAGDTIP